MPLPADGWPPLPALDGAACRTPGVDPLWFFPNAGEPATRARKVCAGCAVSGPCLDYALGCGGTLDGIWAGTSRLDRRRLRRSVLARRPDDSDTEHVDVGPLVVAEPQATNGTTPELGAVGTARTCAGCGASLDGRAAAARWCSETCRSRFKHRQRSTAPAVIAAGPRNGHAVSLDSPTPSAMAWKPVLVALLDCGAQVSFTVDHIHFVATRSETR
jgi:hypothetical protein